MEKQDVDEDGPEDCQPQRDVEARQQQRAAYNLEKRNRQKVVRYHHRAYELAGRATRHRHMHELEKTIQPKHYEAQAEEDASNQHGYLHEKTPA